MSRKGRQGRRSSGGGPAAKRANGSRWGTQAPGVSGSLQSAAEPEPQHTREVGPPPEAERPAAAADAPPAHTNGVAAREQPAPALPTSQTSPSPSPSPTPPPTATATNEDSSYPPVD